MIVVEQRSKVGLTRAAKRELKSELIVDRKDINFRDVSPGVVRVEVRIRNDGDGRSQPTTMRLESAVLGAFVPWRPLAILPVPALAPGESRVLSIDAQRPRPALLGAFDRTPPAKLLTALDSPDEPDRGIGSAFLDLLQRPTTRSITTTSRGVLAPDLSELIGRGNPHWAGNINVFVNRTPVERHVAKALRIYPGRANLAMFVVGARGKRDAYAFDLVGLDPEWKAELFDISRHESLVPGRTDRPIAGAQWVQTAGSMLVMLATRPPEGCLHGNVEVHVTRKSTQKTAVVEFSLDPAAQGTGCYSA